MRIRTEKQTVQTALDDLEYGPVDSPDAYGKVQKASLPDGVSRKRLYRDITLIAWPSFAELLLTQLTGMADQVMVGRMPGEMGVYGLTAVGLATMPKMLIMTTVFAMNVGTTAIVARCRGRQDQHSANHVFQQSVMLNLLMAILLMVVGILCAPWMINFMGGSGIAPATLEMSTLYLRIQFYGFVPLCLTSTITAALRGVGDSRTPMIYNTFANVVNLFFNYVMIYGKFGCPQMGVAGASWATVIGQTAAFVFAMAVTCDRRHYLQLKLRSRFRFDKNSIREIMAIGVPSMAEQYMLRLGLILFQRMVAGLGDVMYATHQVVCSVQSMSLMIGQAFGSASTTLMGQSLGKRRFDMAGIYMRETRRIGMAVAVVTMILMMIFSRQLIGMYNSNPEVISTGSIILFVIAVLLPTQCDQYIVSGGLRGVGDTRFTAMITFITTLVVRLAICVVVVEVLHWGLFGAWVSIAVDIMLRSAGMAMRYKGGKWKAFARLRIQ